MLKVASRNRLRKDNATGRRVPDQKWVQDAQLQRSGPMHRHPGAKNFLQCWSIDFLMSGKADPSET